MGSHSSTWTQPAPKYGPTADYGDCEAGDCRADARVTCIRCSAQVCFGHAEHASHQAESEWQLNGDDGDGKR
jgi:hypothetical protein